MENQYIYNADVDVEITRVKSVSLISQQCVWSYNLKKQGIGYEKFSYILTYVQEGSYRHSLGGADILIPSRSLVLIQMDQRPFRNTSAELPFRYICIRFSVREELPLPFAEYSRIFLTAEHSSGCGEIMKTALSLYTERPFGWKIRLRGIVEELLLRFFAAQSEGKQQTGIPSLITDSLTLIRRNIFTSDLSVEDVALACHISTAHLIRTFRRYLGKTPKKYMDEIRMERACELLKYTDKSMEEIAAESGFREVRRMRRAFHEIAGMSPREYRGKR